MGRTSVFLYASELKKIRYPEDCPFSTQRAVQTHRQVRQMGLLSGRGHSELAPAKATRAEFQLYHAPHYLDILEQAEAGHLDSEGLFMGLGTPDCPVFHGMNDYSALAAGASITGARLLLDGTADVAFNPAGGLHHAMSDRAGGFCYVNDIVLAAMVLADAGKRVVFLDVDAHHCDGVQAAFYDRADVMTVSLHESGKTLFPGTGFTKEIGKGKGRGFTVNIPLPVGTYDDAYLHAFREAALPLIRAYDPDAIILELGMDGLSGDPLAHLHLTNNVHVDVIQSVLALGKPLLATGGGGYHVANTVRGWVLAWSVLCGEYSEHADVGFGGVMLENVDWTAGLRDRVLITDAGRRNAVDLQVDRVIAKLKKTLFPLHGLSNAERGIGGRDRRTRNAEHGTRNRRKRPSNAERGTRNAE